MLLQAEGRVHGHLHLSADVYIPSDCHPETKLDYLVVVALSQVVTCYTWRARNKVLRITLPFAELDIYLVHLEGKEQGS
jgi:hypothetical protein